ncbi:MAG: hypothetical protein M3O65_06535, partial [Actinomycetota bacterium]|nr:hypothetical protein [Actinomycetota bacterium]
RGPRALLRGRAGAHAAHRPPDQHPHPGVTRGLPEVSGARLKRPGTLSSILQQAGVSVDELRDLL